MLQCNPQHIHLGHLQYLKTKHSQRRVAMESIMRVLPLAIFLGLGTCFSAEHQPAVKKDTINRCLNTTMCHTQSMDEQDKESNPILAASSLNATYLSDNQLVILHIAFTPDVDFKAYVPFGQESIITHMKHLSNKLTYNAEQKLFTFDSRHKLTTEYRTPHESYVMSYVELALVDGSKNTGLFMKQLITLNALSMASGIPEEELNENIEQYKIKTIHGYASETYRSFRDEHYTPAKRDKPSNYQIFCDMVLNQWQRPILSAPSKIRKLNDLEESFL